MQEKFVIRTCGCHRDVDRTLSTVRQGRPQAVLAAEKIGAFTERSVNNIRNFLEGKPAKSSDGETVWAFSKSGSTCPDNLDHWAAIFPLTDE